MNTSQNPRSDLIELIENIEELTPEAITAPEVLVSNYFKASGKQQYLLFRNRPEEVALKNGKITLKFISPVWIYDISLALGAENKSEAEKLAKHTSITITDVMGRTHDFLCRPLQSFVDVYPKLFATELVIEFNKINRLGVLSPKCRRITIRGMGESEFSDFALSVSNYLTDSAAFASARTKILGELKLTLEGIEENDRTLQASTEALAQVQSDTEAEKTSLADLQLSITKAEAQLKIISNNDAEVRQRVSENESINKTFAQEIQINKGILAKLQADKNIFMEEYGSYVEQGERNIFSYFAIGLVMILIASVCLWRLIASAASLAGDPAILKDISAFDLFLSRAPLALALAFVAALCLRVVGRLLSKIFEIHQERLLLSKLSILAKDNSFASAEGVDVSPDLIYSQRISLKMELLKEFLAGNYRSAQAKESVLRERFIEFLQRNRKPERDDVEPDLNEPESR